MRLTIEMENITLNDLLTVDTHGEIIEIKDKNASETYSLIPNRETFFQKSGLFANVRDNGLIVIRGKNRYPININKLIDSLNKKRESSVVFIEGFAGCGKSTLVQYILSNQLKTYYYDYNFYNYDLEIQNDIAIRDENGKIQNESSIFEAIKISFFEQYVKISKENPSIINDFNTLLGYCRNFRAFHHLFHKFYNTETYNDIMGNIRLGINCVDDENRVLRLLNQQSTLIRSTICILALDYLLRLAIYKNDTSKKLYICYDNLDAIEDAKDLKLFDDILAIFRRCLDEFISQNQKGFFKNLPLPKFVIMATYRKITASLVDLDQTTYREVKMDKHVGKKDDSVIRIDATSAFSYGEIVSKRHNYFKNLFTNAVNISNHSKKKLLNNFDSWDILNQNLEIMNDRYSCLWNKNYRTCSLIADKLYSESYYQFAKYVDFINKSNIKDGYHSSGEAFLSSYYGGSAILLSSVCKVFNHNHIWDDFLDLAPLNSDKTSHKNVSFARMILTYMYNYQNEAVSLKELFEFFCRNNLFSYTKLCKILSKMLARNLDGVWRRPIYYETKCILKEKAEDIESELLRECETIKIIGDSPNDYRFLLCDSGKAYVERLMQEFEFFSNRLSNKHMPLYLYNNYESLNNVLIKVYTAVMQCCKNMNAFKDKYIELTHISENNYISLPIHPTTNANSSQLHTERTIFSHISYLNIVRRYFIDEETNEKFEVRKKYNKLFVEYIGKYLDLYYNYVSPLCSKRDRIANDLKEIVDEINKAIKNNNNNPNILFQSISIN